MHIVNCLRRDTWLYPLPTVNMNDSQDELNVRLANKMKNNQQQKLEKIKSLSQNNFYTFLFFDCHCSDVYRGGRLRVYFSCWKGVRSWGVCADTKLVAIEGLLISMTLSMLMMRNFSRNLNIINFLFCYREALLPLVCCCCCCWWCCWHFFCYCCRGYLSIFAVNMWTHKFVTLTWDMNRARQGQND